MGALLCAGSLEARADEPGAITQEERAPQRRGIATVRASWRTGVPDYVGASLTVHALPVVDVEVGATLVNPVIGSLYLRAGPRFSLYEGRNNAGRGLSLRLSALAGARNTAAYAVSQGNWTGQWGLNVVGTLEGTYWVLRYLGVSAQLVAGGTTYLPWQGPVRTLRGPLTPDARFSLGLSF
ncbi:hypothetical protein [Vitiosangium sp. GDMCC 1.1324]|uniref:hypothetical protein n=1 Tax=Vitiosangium sp. (strain GDMCC 1.1324) TaxID=2138576 RepID=UPI000D3CF4C0|nr:hypothetical protein [Vitiosangium sp. GDMCC 1.1324]PTL80607.1 hypothetical protein DAT35_28685 [Vitiosangium sp. GDMCC 1.1324]